VHVKEQELSKKNLSTLQVKQATAPPPEQVAQELKHFKQVSVVESGQ
jgi:hypothetical protein